MENPRLSLLSSSSPKLVMRYPTSFKNPTTPKFSISTTRPSLPFPHRTSKTVPHSTRISISSLSQSHGRRRTSKNGSEYFASISSSSGQQTASVGVNPQSVSPPPSQIGSPLFWVGVGVALSAIFSWVATRLKKLKDSGDIFRNIKKRSCTATKNLSVMRVHHAIDDVGRRVPPKTCSRSPSHQPPA